MLECPTDALWQDWLDFLEIGRLHRWAGWKALDEVLLKELLGNGADAVHRGNAHEALVMVFACASPLLAQISLGSGPINWLEAVVPA